MRLCVPSLLLEGGGRATFFHYLLSFLERSGIAFTQDIDDDYDALFANSWAVSYKAIRRVKERDDQIRIVHRIDGSARNYGRLDDADARQARINTLSDLSIFQSKYGRQTTTEAFKIISRDGPVIYNPVDVDSFRPGGDRMPISGRIRVGHVTFSTNILKGTQTLYRIAEENPDIEFVLIGRYEAVPRLGNVRALGLLDRESLPAALRGCDVFVTFSENDTCPNTVLEALSCGLPVLYRDSGGVAELVGPGGLPVDVGSFRRRLEEALDCRSELGSAARGRAERLFAPDVIFPAYLAAIEKSERYPVPTVGDLLRLRAQGYHVLDNRLMSIGRRGFHRMRRWLPRPSRS